jgi:hypothetical protein
MSGAFNTITSAFRGGLVPKAARAYIIPLDIHNGDKLLKDDVRTFQYFPATIQDSKATNYQTKVIPGLSHPLYQWTSSGARTISFQAIFTRDRNMTNQERAFSLIPRTGVATTSGQRTARNISIGGGQNAGGAGIALSEDPRNVDIPSAVAWLRAFLDPEYSADGTGKKSTVPARPHPPRKMILGFPGVRINWGVTSLPPTEMYCIMVGCEVNYDGFFGDGTPRMARVDLAFAEIIQVHGQIEVQDASWRRTIGHNGYQLTDKAIKDSIK